MTDQEKQKLKEKLAKWVGWHEEKYEVTRGAFAPILLAPSEELGEGHVGYIPEHTPNFPDSLDACVKWLVPRLTGWTLAKHRDEAEYKASVLIGDPVRDKISPAAYAETPSLALCLAIEKLIEGGT